MIENKENLVSVIMGIYNCADTLDEAILSILSQTMGSWELIMCDDGSIDSTYAIAESYRSSYPNKITLIRNTTNMGLNHTLNRCLDLAHGKYIARQDGDDMSLPNRFEVQVRTLEQHPEMAVVSASMSLFDSTGEWGKIARKDFPEKQDLIYGTPFAHAPCIVRAEVMRAVGGYSDETRLIRVEDYHLWYKIYKAGYKGMNLQEVLYRCRDDRAAQKRRKMIYRINESYVRWLVFKELRLSPVRLLLVIKPILVGLLPTFIYKALHRLRLGNTVEQCM